MAKILIVDDDPDIVSAVSVFLDAKGQEIRSAYNKEEGLAAVESFDPDLLILDVMMDQPDDGLVMAQELRRKAFKKPILMLTAMSRVTGFDYGKDDEIAPVDAFVEKPIDIETLWEKIQEMLEKKEG